MRPRAIETESGEERKGSAELNARRPAARQCPSPPRSRRSVRTAPRLPAAAGLNSPPPHATMPAGVRGTGTNPRIGVPGGRLRAAETRIRLPPPSGGATIDGVRVTFQRVSTLLRRAEVRISEHGYDQLAQDGIAARDAVAGAEDGVVVEDYPDYPKGPCVLVLQRDAAGSPIHVVWGIPKGAESPRFSSRHTGPALTAGPRIS